MYTKKARDKIQIFVRTEVICFLIKEINGDLDVPVMFFPRKKHTLPNKKPAVAMVRNPLHSGDLPGKLRWQWCVDLYCT